MLNTTSARLYAARWALVSHDPASDDLAPKQPSALCRAVLLHLPLWLPQWLLAVVCMLFCPHLQAKEITDGNVNYSFVITGRNGRAVFVKQAEGFLKWQPQMALERERMAREVQYFRDAAAALGDKDAGRFLPRIHHFDKRNTIFVMEYLDGHTVAFDLLFSRGRIARAAAEGLGTFLARVHARTLDRGDADAPKRAIEYWNPTLRAIQLEHVYSLCFAESTRGRQLAGDAELMAEVRLLKAKYLGYSFDELDRCALCHGDLHPGGVMVRRGSVKVIDPEFVAWAPPGLDVGSLMSGFILARLYHVQRGGAPTDAHARAPGRRASSPPRGARAEAADADAAKADSLELHAALAALWGAYEEGMAAEGVSRAQLARISEDSAGYAMMEVVRTSLGFAGARDPSRRITDADALGRYQNVAVQLVRSVLLHRRGPQTRKVLRGVPLLLDLLGQIDAAAFAEPAANPAKKSA